MKKQNKQAQEKLEVLVQKDVSQEKIFKFFDDLGISKGQRTIDLERQIGVIEASKPYMQRSKFVFHASSCVAKE